MEMLAKARHGNGGGGGGEELHSLEALHLPCRCFTAPLTRLRTRRRRQSGKRCTSVASRSWLSRGSALFGLWLDSTHAHGAAVVHRAECRSAEQL